MVLSKHIIMQVKGVKGPSWLSCLAFIDDIVDGMSADYMHAVLLEVVKLLFTLWLETSRCQVLPCHIRSKQHLIINRIEKICPPSEITHGTSRSHSTEAASIHLLLHYYLSN